MTKIPKYRPVLTAEQITYILYMCRIQEPLTEEAMSIIISLGPFKAKIDDRGIQAAYVAGNAPKASIPANAPTSVAPYNPMGKTKEEVWEECYNKWNTEGSSACSLREIEGANEHRYLNDLMSAEEVAAFDKISFNL